MGKTAQSGDVLALHICLGSQKFLVIGIAGIEGLLIVCLELLHFFLVLGNSRKLRGYLIGEDDTESVAAHRDITKESVRIGYRLLLQDVKFFGNKGFPFSVADGFFTLHSSFFTPYGVVEVHERHTRELSDVASAFSSLEEARHGK